MAPMTSGEIEQYLQEPLVAVLAVARPQRGPAAIPIWFEYSEGAIRMTTAPDSVHGRLLAEAGRATLVVHSESYDGVTTRQRHVTAEGPAVFTDDPVEPLVMRLRSRYFTGDRAAEWVNRPLSTFQATERVVVLTPEHLSGSGSVQTI